MGQVGTGRYKLTYRGCLLIHCVRLVVELLCSLIEILGPFISPPCLVQLSPATQRTTLFDIFIFFRYEPLRVHAYDVSFFSILIFLFQYILLESDSGFP